MEAAIPQGVVGIECKGLFDERRTRHAIISY